MLRLSTLLQAGLLVVAAAISGVHGLGVQDASATELQQGSHDSLAIEDPVSLPAAGSNHQDDLAAAGRDLLGPRWYYPKYHPKYKYYKKPPPKKYKKKYYPKDPPKKKYYPKDPPKKYYPKPYYPKPYYPPPYYPPPKAFASASANAVASGSGFAAANANAAAVASGAGAFAAAKAQAAAFSG